jgi:hypothetical protein
VAVAVQDVELELIDLVDAATHRQRDARVIDAGARIVRVAARNEQEQEKWCDQ